MSVDESVALDTNIGHLLKEPTEIVCPACNAVGLTTLRQEVVTCVQKIVAVINFCCCCTPIKWEGRHDFNHYCSKCGCFIGRTIKLSWYKRQLFKARRSALEEDRQWRRFKQLRQVAERKNRAAQQNQQNQQNQPNQPQ